MLMRERLLIPCIIAADSLRNAVRCINDGIIDNEGNAIPDKRLANRCAALDYADIRDSTLPRGLL